MFVVQENTVMNGTMLQPTLYFVVIQYPENPHQCTMAHSGVTTLS
jgi:hypothetical protein